MTQEIGKLFIFRKRNQATCFSNRNGNLEDFWELCKALIKASKNPEKSKLDEIKTGENNLKEILKKNQPVSLKDLVIKGKDLIELGYKEGKEIKDILNELLNLVLEKPELNQKKILQNLVKNLTI